MADRPPGLQSGVRPLRAESQQVFLLMQQSPSGFADDGNLVNLVQGLPDNCFTIYRGAMVHAETVLPFIPLVLSFIPVLHLLIFCHSHVVGSFIVDFSITAGIRTSFLFDCTAREIFPLLSCNTCRSLLDFTSAFPAVVVPFHVVATLGYFLFSCIDLVW